jgi:hypothetical protein
MRGYGVDARRRYLNLKRHGAPSGNNSRPRVGRRAQSAQRHELAWMTWEFAGLLD